MPALIPLIAAGVGAAGTAYAANQANRGQRQAASASQQATDQATAEQRRQYDLSRQDMLPYQQVGTGALGQLASLYGLSQPGAQQPAQQGYAPAMGGGIQTGSAGYPIGSGMNRLAQMGMTPAMTMDAVGGAQINGGPGGDIGGGVMPAVAQINGGPGGAVPGQPVPQVNPGTGQGGQYDTFWQSPDYNVRMSEAMRALTARNAALGIQDSGAAQRSALNVSGGLAAGEYNNYANRLAALAGVGQTAASQNAALGQNYAGNVGNLLTNNAQNLASSYQNRAAINGQFGQQLAGGLSGFITNRWG